MLPKTEECLKHLADYESSRQAAIEELTAAKRDIEQKLSRLLGNEPKKSERKQPACSKCGQPGHSARSCKGASETDGQVRTSKAAE